MRLVRPNGVWRVGDVVVNSALQSGQQWDGQQPLQVLVVRQIGLSEGSSVLLQGATGSRPTKTIMGVSTDARWAGTQYLDTTLDADGKLITWNGTAWVDATGRLYNVVG